MWQIQGMGLFQMSQKSNPSLPSAEGERLEDEGHQLPFQKLPSSGRTNHSHMAQPSPGSFRCTPFLSFPPKIEGHLPGKDLQQKEACPEETWRKSLYVTALGTLHRQPSAKSHHLLIFRKSREDGNTRENIAEQTSLWPYSANSSKKPISRGILLQELQQWLEKFNGHRVPQCNSQHQLATSAFLEMQVHGLCCKFSELESSNACPRNRCLRRFPGDLYARQNLSNTARIHNCCFCLISIHLLFFQLHPLMCLRKPLLPVSGCTAGTRLFL